jgi:hypothetical protein
MENLDLNELDDFVINNMKNCKTELLTKEKNLGGKADLESSTLEGFINELSASYEIEDDIITQEQAEKLKEYLLNLATYEAPDIKSLYSILFPNKQLYRKEPVVIGRQFDKNGKCIKACHIGIDPKYINDDLFNEIQNMINDFYDLMKTTNKINLNIITKAFELYIKFERIHLFRDGNGRLGRLIFLEHPFNYGFFPVARMLKALGMDKIVNDVLFDKYDLEYNYYNLKEYTKEDYLNFEIDNDTKFEIYKLIYKFIVFRNLKHINKKYVPCIRTILKTKIENIYDKCQNKYNWYDYDDIACVINDELHNILI